MPSLSPIESLPTELLYSIFTYLNPGYLWLLLRPISRTFRDTIEHHPTRFLDPSTAYARIFQKGRFAGFDYCLPLHSFSRDRKVLVFKTTKENAWAAIEPCWVARDIRDIEYSWSSVWEGLTWGDTSTLSGPASPEPEAWHEIPKYEVKRKRGKPDGYIASIITLQDGTILKVGYYNGKKMRVEVEVPIDAFFRWDGVKKLNMDQPFCWTHERETVGIEKSRRVLQQKEDNVRATSRKKLKSSHRALCCDHYSGLPDASLQSAAVTELPEGVEWTMIPGI
ncbi:hypothetical protein YB2330_003639 [Saitoella coloradoensis]